MDERCGQRRLLLHPVAVPADGSVGVGADVENGEHLVAAGGGDGGLEATQFRNGGDELSSAQTVEELEWIEHDPH